MAEEDYYKILGVDHDASQQDINKAYRKLSKKYHPDINHEPGAEDKFKKINKAYGVLGNKNKRAQYDQFGSSEGQDQGFGGQGFGGQGFGSQGFGGFGGGGFDDIFNTFFGGGARGGGRARRDPNAPRPGRDLQYEMNLNFTDAVFGKRTSIQYNREGECDTCKGSGAKPGTHPETCHNCNGSGYVTTVSNTPLGRMQSQRPCPVCHGSGQEIKHKCPTCGGSGKKEESHEIEVNIPAGVDTGHQMRLQHQGEAGTNGGPYGDLFIVFNVKPSKNFQRQGSDIYYNKSISFSEAALGSDVRVKSLDDEKKNEDGELSLHIPAGTQTGTTFNLKGKGIPGINGNPRGSEKITINLSTPKRLNKRQKEALQAFAEASGEGNDTGKGGSFFDKMKDAFDKK